MAAFSNDKPIVILPVPVTPRETPIPVARHVSRFQWSVRALAGCALATMICSLGPPPVERLVAERRDAHARELTTCGRKKACIMKPNASVHAAAATLADITPPTSQLHPRWAESQYDNVTVWIAPGEEIARWRSANRFMVRNAFHAWSAAGAPVRFVFVSDSLRADVRVLWRDSLPDARAGQVTRLADRRGWLRAATIEMSTRNMAGGAQDSVTVGAVALHEVGHLLGLEHSANDHDIMAAWVIAPALTEHDRAAMRALYGVERR